MISALYKNTIGGYKSLVIIGIALLSLVVARDIIHSTVRDYSFYLSESLLFSAFWLLFIPLTHICKVKARKKPNIFLPIVLILLHLSVFSLWVFLMSTLFFEHAFDFYRTLVNTTAQYGIVCILFYGFCYFLFLDKEVGSRDVVQQKVSEKIKVRHQNKAVILNCNDIVYVKSEKPYIALITKERTYLHKISLKSFLERHGTMSFMQIHKSIVINTDDIVSYTSRKNGDYDVRLTNQHVVRASRNYNGNFRPFFDNIGLE